MSLPADAQFLQIETAAHEGAHGHNPLALPTEAQHAAGNYKKGRTTWQGLRIAIEQPRGTYRTGRSRGGKAWSTRMAAHYGYFEGIKGADGDELDCFIGFYPQADTAFVVNQQVGGRFDEHKVMLAFPDQASAERAYRDSYERGWNGLHSITPASISQLKWWLKNGDKSRPLLPEFLPHEGLETMNTPIAWDASAQPKGMNAAVLLYEIRRSDAGAGLLMDSVTRADILEDADEVFAMDAMVTPYAKVERKMEVLRGVMERASATVKPVALQVTDPFKQRGVVNVAGIFELSDGQTVSVYLHNPDTTPNKLAPTDELISWKWLLNKKDITIVVAPEQGEDLNVREVARRIMTLAEKNSAAFQRVNSKRAERMQAIQGLKDEIAGLEVELTQAQRELEVAKVEAEDRKARAAEQEAAQRERADRVAAVANITSPDGYRQVWAEGGNRDLQEKWQDVLDPLFQSRLVEVRNELRKLGWDGPTYGELSKGNAALAPKFEQVGAGRNVVGIIYRVAGDGAASGADDGVRDTLELTPAELAAEVDLLTKKPGTEGGGAAASNEAGLTPEGRESTVKTAKGNEVVTGFAVVEADTLITSHDPETGSPNPKFPQELQPRDRGRDTSRAWVIKTAGNLDPEQLGKTRRADTGAPIVGQDGIVESGNGRTMAIVLAYAHGKAGEYRDWLEAEAEYFGLSADKIKAMRKPVLVRVRTSQIDRAAFAVEANQDDKLAMTATEKARADARRLTDDMIALMTDNGDLTAAANQPFLSAFLRSLGDAEAAQYSTSDGKPTSTLIARVQAAIFAKAYNDDRLLELTADSAKPEIASIISALNFAAPEFIQAAALDTDASDAASKKLVDSIEASLNTQAVNAILGATNVLKQAKDAGMQVEEFVKQQGLFGDIDPAVATMAMFIAKNNRSGKRMGTAFKAMATFIKSEIQRRQTADMFGEPEPIGFEQIVQAANREMDKVFGEGAFAIETEDLFATGNKSPADEPQKAPHAALSEALKRGDLKAALDIIWGQPSPMAASEAVLKAGFSIGSNKTIKEIVDEGAADLTLAAKMKMDGFELRAWKEGQSRPAGEIEPQNIIGLEEIFSGLAGAGLVRKRAKDAADAHPQSAAIWNIHNNFSDILAGLESAGAVAVTR